MHFGTTPTVTAFLISIPIGMVAYTGIETISNMAEEARDPARDVPRSIGLVAAAVFAIYAFLPAVALSAMPVHETPALSQPAGHARARTSRRRSAPSTPATRCRASCRTSASGR